MHRGRTRNDIPIPTAARGVGRIAAGGKRGTCIHDLKRTVTLVAAKTILLAIDLGTPKLGGRRTHGCHPTAVAYDRYRAIVELIDAIVIIADFIGIFCRLEEVIIGFFQLGLHLRISIARSNQIFELRLGEGNLAACGKRIAPRKGIGIETIVARAARRHRIERQDRLRKMGVCRLGQSKLGVAHSIDSCHKGLIGIHIIVIVAVVVETRAIRLEHIAPTRHIIHRAIHKPLHGMQITHRHLFIRILRHRLIHIRQKEIDHIRRKVAKIGILRIVAHTIIGEPLDKLDDFGLLAVVARRQNGHKIGNDGTRRRIGIAGKSNRSTRTQTLVEQKVEIVVKGFGNCLDTL